MLDLDLDMRTVRCRYWKSGGDMRLAYREIKRRDTAGEKGEKDGKKKEGGEEGKKREGGEKEGKKEGGEEGKKREGGEEGKKREGEGGSGEGEDSKRERNDR